MPRLDQLPTVDRIEIDRRAHTAVAYDADGVPLCALPLTGYGITESARGKNHATLTLHNQRLRFIGEEDG